MQLLLQQLLLNGAGRGERRGERVEAGRRRLEGKRYAHLTWEDRLP